MSIENFATQEALEPVHDGEVVEPAEHYIDQGPNYVRFSSNTPFEVWHAYVKHLSRIEKGGMWWIGDTLNFGEYAYGDIAAQADASDFEPETFRRAKWVCKRIEPYRRRYGLGFSHHIEVAALEPDDQDHWLDEAEGGLTRNKLREAIREAAKRRKLGAATAVEEEESETDEEEPQTLLVGPGQWWKLGEHRLFCGDSSSEEFTNNLTKVPLAFADPPYNAGVAHWDHGFGWAHDYLIDTSDVVVVTPGIASIADFFKVTKMPYVWSVAGFISNGMTRGAVGYGNWVYAAVFSWGSVYRQAQDAVRFPIETSTTEETSHKGRKPHYLMAHIVDTFSKKRETVVDPFLGSGATLFACEELERRCVGAEIEPEYCEDILRRFHKKTGHVPERVA